MPSPGSGQARAARQFGSPAAREFVDDMAWRDDSAGDGRDGVGYQPTVPFATGLDSFHRWVDEVGGLDRLLEDA
ncbi:hypothetical protein ACFWUP_05520 [Nocardia sp. NPDC058658]|uniref:hypothetical protein n=1 Tax=Nocardia sp. NPDC058658 TaxID=3346580 RepID=UPI00365D0955